MVSAKVFTLDPAGIQNIACRLQATPSRPANKIDDDVVVLNAVAAFLDAINRTESCKWVDPEPRFFHDLSLHPVFQALTKFQHSTR